MNTANAFAFVVLGTVMNRLPSLLPWLAGKAGKGNLSETSVLWLQFMGVVVFAIGSSYAARELFVRVPVWLEALRPIRVVPALPEPTPMPVSEGEGVRAAA